MQPRENVAPWLHTQLRANCWANARDIHTALTKHSVTCLSYQTALLLLEIANLDVQSFLDDYEAGRLDG